MCVERETSVGTESNEDWIYNFNVSISYRQLKQQWPSIQQDAQRPSKDSNYTTCAINKTLISLPRRMASDGVQRYPFLNLRFVYTLRLLLFCTVYVVLFCLSVNSLFLNWCLI